MGYVSGPSITWTGISLAQPAALSGGGSYVVPSSRSWGGGGGGSSYGYGGGSSGVAAPASAAWRAPSTGRGWNTGRGGGGGWRPPAQGMGGRPAGGGNSARMRLLAQSLAQLQGPLPGPAWQQGIQQGSPGNGWNPWTGEYRAPDVPVV